MTNQLEALIAEMKIESANNGGMFLHRPDISMLIAALEQSEANATRLLVQHVDGLKERIAELESSKLAVKLPPKFNVQMGGDKITRIAFRERNTTIDECAKAIRAAGITVQGGE